MRAEGSDEWAKARNSNIIEDLGRVGYVFSDKTGTLTSNEMRMRALAIKGVPYGGTDFKCAPRPLGRRALLPSRMGCISRSPFVSRPRPGGGVSKGLSCLQPWTPCTAAGPALMQTYAVRF